MSVNKYTSHEYKNQCKNMHKFRYIMNKIRIYINKACIICTPDVYCNYVAGQNGGIKWNVLEG